MTNHVARFRFQLGVIAAVLACPHVARVARADDDPAALAAARSLGVEGVKLADAGQCDEAVGRLERSERLHHAPTTLGRLGECYVRLGRVVLGTETLQRVLREPLAANAPAAFVAAHARAQKILDEAKPRIAQLRIVVQVANGATADVKVDGEMLPAAFLGVDRPTDPGTHEIVARAPGFLETARSITLADGARTEVTLALAPVLQPSPEREPETEPVVTKPPQSAPRTPRQPNHRRTVGFALLATGGAGIALGSVFGILAIATKDDLDAACGVDKGCPPDQRDNIGALKTQGTVSTAAFVLGGLSLATGVVLVVTSNEPRRISVALDPNALSLRGRF